VRDRQGRCAPFVGAATSLPAYAPEMKKLERAEGPRWYSRWWGWLERHANPLQVVLGTLAIIATVVLGLAALPHGKSDSSDSGSHQTETQSTASQSGVPSSPQPTSAEPGGGTNTGGVSAAVGLGTCYARSNDRRLSNTPCSNAHEYEVISTSARCTYSSGLKYVGGQSGLDVLGGRLDARSLSGWCLLSSLKDSTKGSAKDVFDNPTEDDSWRRCEDTDAGRAVSCDEPHNREYLATGSPGESTGTQCLVKAEAYMDKQYESVDGDLQLGPLENVASDVAEARCALTARGPGQQMSASVRWLREGQLPFL
jgi:hypothetical protein